VAALAALTLAALAPPGRSVIGGGAIRIQAAPWAVFVEQADGPNRFLCSGTILDASQVITAAHCLFNQTGARAATGSLSVEAGTSNFDLPLATDRVQERSVSSYRIHPDYISTLIASSDDVAVLDLSSPLHLDGETAEAVALPRPDSPFPAQLVLGLAGFGRERGTGLPDGRLHWLVARVDPQGSCGRPDEQGVIPNNGISFCAASRSGATCNGDSGAGLVAPGTHPTLIGVVSGGSETCAVGSHTLYAWVDAGEVRSFLLGSSDPPRAPRETNSTFVDLTWEAPLVVGATLHCSTGRWQQPGSLSYSFRTTGGAVLYSGRAQSFELQRVDRGASVYCEVAARSAGGTTIDLTGATSRVEQAPALRLEAVAPQTGERGEALRLRVAFHAPPGLSGKFGVCLTPPGSLGHRVCSSLAHQHGGRGTFTFTIGFRVDPAAPPGRSLLLVSAVAGVASASESVVVDVEAR
jgi:hypothetical protein